MVNNIELLVDAVLENDINLVKELLHKDINFDAIVRLSDINSEIYYVTFIQFLIENLYYRECDKNCEDDEDDYNKCKNITKLILQLFDHIDQEITYTDEDKEKYDCILLIEIENYPDIVEYLLQQGKEIQNFGTHFWNIRNVETMEILYNTGFRIDSYNDDNFEDEYIDKMIYDDSIAKTIFDKLTCYDSSACKLIEIYYKIGININDILRHLKRNMCQLRSLTFKNIMKLNIVKNFINVLKYISTIDNVNYFDIILLMWNIMISENIFDTNIMKYMINQLMDNKLIHDKFIHNEKVISCNKHIIFKSINNNIFDLCITQNEIYNCFNYLLKMNKQSTTKSKNYNDEEYWSYYIFFDTRNDKIKKFPVSFIDICIHLGDHENLKYLLENYVFDLKFSILNAYAKKVLYEDDECLGIIIKHIMLENNYLETKQLIYYLKDIFNKCDLIKSNKIPVDKKFITFVTKFVDNISFEKHKKPVPNRW